MSIKYPDKKTYKKSVKTILDSVYGEEKKKFSYKPVIAGLTAAVLCALIIFNFGTIKVLAEKLGEKLGFLDKSNEKLIIDSENSNIPDYINYDVYSDANEHVKFEITELLSDGIYSMAVVRYTGLDEEGIRWVKEHFVTQKEINEDVPAYATEVLVDDLVMLKMPKGYDGIMAKPTLLKNDGNDYCCLAWTRGTARINDNKKPELIFDYKLSDDNGGEIKKTVNIIPEKELPFIYYELESDNDNVEIEKFGVSGLSLIMDGSQNEADESKGLDEIINSFVLVYKDGSEVKLNKASSASNYRLNEEIYKQTGLGKYNITFELHGYLWVPSEETFDRIKEFKNDKIESVVLGSTITGDTIKLYEFKAKRTEE